MRHTHISRTLSRLLLVSCCLLLAACAGRMKEEPLHPPIPSDLTVIRSQPMETAESANMESASLNISDPKGYGGEFVGRLERMLADRQFSLTDQPSLAERIISLKLLYKGKGSLAEMKSAVMAGYDTPLPRMSGDDSVFVADLLLVRRRIPPSNTEISTVSARNTVSSSSVRIGLHTSRSSALKDRALEEALARDVAQLAASDVFRDQHEPSELVPLKPSQGKAVKKSKSSKKSTKKSAAKAKSKKSSTKKAAVRTQSKKK